MNDFIPSDLCVESFSNTTSCVMTITHTPTGLSVQGMASGSVRELRRNLLIELSELVDGHKSAVAR